MMQRALLLACAGLAVATVNEEAKVGGACYHNEQCRMKPVANARMKAMMMRKASHIDECTKKHECPPPKRAQGRHNCVDGKVSFEGEVYDCQGVDLMSYISQADLGSPVNGNDIWGWTDPETGHEIAIVCLGDGTSFVDVTDAENPTVLGYLRGTHYPASVAWRDAKVYKNHAYIGSEVADHGLQVFDMTTLRQYYGRTGVNVPNLSNTAFYDEFGSSHNIVINEATGMLYAVGTRTFRGGPHIVDIREPANPRFVAGWDTDGYTHDAECVVYHGPDSRYSGKELCFNYNEDSLTIVDVSDKENIFMVSRTEYNNNFYCHQGWLTEDHSMLIMDDELDETYASTDANKKTRSLVWDVKNLARPVHQYDYISSEYSVDHNMYIKDNIAYQSNYCAGLRIIDARDLGNATAELAFFDVAPYCDTTTTRGVTFQGTWSNYPYFKSGNIVLNSIERGLFVLRVQDGVLNNLRLRAGPKKL
ncbi:hypothetical protein DIPPA_27655 [Diplonema papillatum]|nr:hypothetical protein DIPPA_27655 [Diplonema papillatum]